MSISTLDRVISAGRVHGDRILDQIATAEVPLPAQRPETGDVKPDYSIDGVLITFAQMTLTAGPSAARSAVIGQTLTVTEQFIAHLSGIPVGDPNYASAQDCLRALYQLTDKQLKPGAGSPGCPTRRTPDAIADAWNATPTDATNVMARLAYLRGRLTDGSWSGTNALHQEMALINARSFIGQLIEDFACARAFAVFSPHLIGLLQANGFAHVADAIAHRPGLRGNPILAEIPIDVCIADLAAGRTLEEERLRTSANPVISRRASEISATLCALLADRIHATYSERNGRAHGMRGRSPTRDPAIARDLHPHRIAFTPEMNQSPSLQHDRRVGELTLSNLTTEEQRRKIREACVHGSSPTTRLIDGSINPIGTSLEDPDLRTEFVDTLIALGLNAATAGEAADQALAAAHDIMITVNQNPLLRLPLALVEKMPSAVRIMQRSGLTTVCGPSGTTVDIVNALVAELGVNEVRARLQPLYDFAYLDREISPGEWQNLLQSIGFFMQAGDYHSVSEVMAGLLIGATELCAPLTVPPPAPAESALRTLTALSKLSGLLAHETQRMMGRDLPARTTTILDEVRQAVEAGEDARAAGERRSPLANVARAIGAAWRAFRQA